MANNKKSFLVHANVAHARAAFNSLILVGFTSQIEEINSLARRSAGFVALPKLPDQGLIYVVRILLNVSIWKSVKSLDMLTHQGKHAAAF
jgi:hypothetical protein